MRVNETGTGTHVWVCDDRGRGGGGGGEISEGRSAPVMRGALVVVVVEGVRGDSGLGGEGGVVSGGGVSGGGGAGVVKYHSGQVGVIDRPHGWGGVPTGRVGRGGDLQRDWECVCVCV